MSSRRRPYLDLKKSFLERFQSRARWLHDTLSKESIFEKPYLDEDYRQMHLNIPESDWGRRDPREPLPTLFRGPAGSRRGPAGPTAGPGMWPKQAIGEYIWPDVDCWAHIWSPVRCGESFSGGAWIAGIGLGGSTSDDEFAWTVQSSEGEVKITEATSSIWSLIFDFKGEVGSTFEGTAIISIVAKKGSPYLKRWKAYYTIPAWAVKAGLPPEMFKPRQSSYNPVPIPRIFGVEYYDNTTYPCNAVELKVTCNVCLACTTETPTISPTTQSLSVNEEENFVVINYGLIPAECFTWAITSGEGTLSTDTGYATTYTAPATNAECAGNPTISLSCDGVEKDTLAIAINADTGAAIAYTHLISGPSTDDCVSGDCSGGGLGYLCWQIARYKCNGTYIDTSALWRVDNGGSNCNYNSQNKQVSTCVGSVYCCTAPITALNCMIEYQATQSRTLGDHTDERTAQMITDGCCPGVLL